ncbi:MAG TPA: DUF6285 domain-containing protein [Acetobacteraceae bacterium]|nr:DUF6285 domain-containing protein [Acetobacteraceae bacterium]
MLERPDGADLLATAREVVLQEILPALPEPARIQARMVAAAIALALREREAEGEAALRAELAALTGAGEAQAQAAFAAAIRAGRFDPGTEGHGAALDLLRRMARLRAAVSAPRALSGG